MVLPALALFLADHVLGLLHRPAPDWLLAVLTALAFAFSKEEVGRMLGRIIDIVKGVK